MKQDEIMPVVTVILSIAALIGPVIFGFVLWKMQAVFVSKETFADYKNRAEEERREMKTALISISKSNNDILVAIAHLQTRGSGASITDQ